MKELSFERMTEIEGGASLAAWGCGISIGIVGALWSTAFGMVSAGAGFVVGVAYTALAIAACADL